MAKKKTTRKKTTKKKTGRPLAKVDAKQVEALASICCTQDEMAVIVGCSKDTLQRRFAAAIERGMATAKASLRRTQWKAANNGNATMMIWLGKQYLDQRDKKDIHTEGQTALTISEKIIPARVKLIEGNGQSNGNGHKSNGNGTIPAASRLSGPN